MTLDEELQVASRDPRWRAWGQAHPCFLLVDDTIDIHGAAMAVLSRPEGYAVVMPADLRPTYDGLGLEDTDLAILLAWWTLGSPEP